MLRRCAGAVVLLLGGLSLVACTPGLEDSSSETPSPPAASTPPVATTSAPSPSPEPTAGPGQTQALVYFQIDGPNGARLVREPHSVAAGEPTRGAIEAMIAGPTDPDYLSPWNPDTRVLGISTSGTTVIVDLSREARTANAGSAFAALLKQQLIYTVTEQLGDDKQVLLHIDGEPAGELWGVVDWTTPEPRADWSETLLLVGIDTPAEGATVPSPVVVTGQAAVFEATVLWRVLTPEGSVVQDGFAMTSEGMTLAPYRFEVALPNGEYVIEVAEDDPSGGEGGPVDVDNRTVTVAD